MLGRRAVDGDPKLIRAFFGVRGVWVGVVSGSMNEGTPMGTASRQVQDARTIVRTQAGIFLLYSWGSLFGSPIRYI